MKDYTAEDKCHCPIECDSVSYSFSLVSKPLDPDELCPSKIPKVYDPMETMIEFYKNPFPPRFIRYAEKYLENKTAVPADMCKRNIMYRSLITFRYATDTIPVTVMSRRLSFFDKLSGFGKTIKLNSNSF